MKPNNKKNQMEKTINSYYSYLGYCHTGNIIKELDDKKDEIRLIELSSSMDVWFNKFSKKHRRKNKLEEMMAYIQKIGKKIIILIITVLNLE